MPVCVCVCVLVYFTVNVPIDRTSIVCAHTGTPTHKYTHTYFFRLFVSAFYVCNVQ